jgi:hypothetical protein
MGINNGEVGNGSPDSSSHIPIFPKCLTFDFYVKNAGNDEKDCDHVDEACKDLAPTSGNKVS